MWTHHQSPALPVKCWLHGVCACMVLLVAAGITSWEETWAAVEALLLALCVASNMDTFCPLPPVPTSLSCS